MVLLVRALRMLGTFVLASVIVFLLSWIAPGDAAYTIAGENATPERVEEIRHMLGLDLPAYQQYFRWAGNAIQGDLGASSLNNIPVSQEIMTRLPVTVSLALLTTVLAVILSVAIGLVASLNRGSWMDRLVTGAASVGMSLPEFWLALMLIIWLGLGLGIFPVSQYVPLSENPGQWLMHLALPALTMGITKTAELARQVRSSMSQVLDEPYIRTARAKGLSPAQVVGKHALKNAGTAFVTILGVRIGVLLGGTVVIEKVFSLPGLGSLMVSSVLTHDLPMVQGVAIVIALMVLIINFLVDLSYHFFNPKVRLG